MKCFSPSCGGSYIALCLLQRYKEIQNAWGGVSFFFSEQYFVMKEIDL